MEWTMMEPGGSGASCIGSLIGDIYVPSDECEDVLDDIIEMLLKEDPKLRNARRKLFFEKVIEKDLVPLVKFCADEDIIGRAVRLLANLSQPLEVFLQLGYPLGTQCQREIVALVNNAKMSCVDIDFFKSLNRRVVHALSKGGKVEPSDSEMVNHCLLLMRNLLHVGSSAASDEPQPNSTAITLQSMLSSFFLSEMDKLVLQLLHHPQRADWVVSIVQLLSLVFKDYAGVLLDGESEDEDRDDSAESPSDGYGGSDILEFIPSQTSKFLSKDFDKQLQLGTSQGLDTGAASPGIAQKENNTGGDLGQYGTDLNLQDGLKEKMMQTDEDVERSEKVKPENTPTLLTKSSSDEGIGESMSISVSSDRKEKSDSDSSNNKSSPTHDLEQEEFMSMSEDGDKFKVGCVSPGAPQVLVSAAEDKEEAMLESAGKKRKGSSGSDKDGEVVDMASMVWDSIQRTEKEIMSELLSGSCLMDVDIIVSYLKQFASEIVCSGLSTLVRCLMKALMSTYEGILDDSFFMWTVGFFLSYARHSQIEFEKYKEILNLDVFGFLVYQGFRNCETLIIQHHKQENCCLTKYRLHLVVCTLNQMFQVILTHSKEDTAEGSYVNTLQRCLAQMGDLQRLFILLIRAHQSPPQDFVYLRDLVHTNHIYLLLLENWVSRGYIPPRFSMLSHVQQFAAVDVMRKYGCLLEEYTNNETLNVAVMTMMYHVAGDCNRGDVLLQLPILKKFSEIWGDVTCTKYVEFNDLIEFVLENFMTMAFKDPVKCAQQLFDLSTPETETLASADGSETQKVASTEIGGLTDEEQDLLFTWTTDLQGSVNIVDDLVQRLHQRGSTASRQQVMLHLLRNGWLEEKQMEVLSDEIKELHEIPDTTTTHNPIAAEISGLGQDQLVPFVLEKIRSAGFGDQLAWLQEQLLEAAYVRLGVRNPKYRVHVEEPLARFYALQDKSIPLVTVNEAQEGLVKDPYFTILLQSLGLFPADTDRFFFCRIPHFLTPAQLVRKAQLLGDINMGILKFDLAEVESDFSFTEFTPLLKDHGGSVGDRVHSHAAAFSKPARDQNHQWLNFVCHLNNVKQQAGD